VTRINIEEITQTEDVAFKTVVQNDAKLGWQEKKITTSGQLGKKEVQYRITYKNGKEISRIVLGSKITQDSVAQVETHGTYMQLGKANAGQGTWYAYQGGLFAASTTIPKGAYAKVTNTQNGKSVVVQINDYGPTGKGRIIDLDKVAFSKISSLGSGVIGVKVEPILN
jgi:rare lipoprotein A (peptidoglycan hydrolase)